jgi:L-xylulokinase
MYLGLDLGLTVIKGVVYNNEGMRIYRSAAKPLVLNPQENFYERDCENLWQSVKNVLKDITNYVDPMDIKGLSLSGYGDGCYLLDKDKKLLDNGIMSYDKRAQYIIDKWDVDGINSDALKLIGQKLFPAMPPCLLRWYKLNRIETYKKICHILSCKDFVRFKLTGEIATDYTDASAGFTRVNTQEYSDELLRLFDISEVMQALPIIKNSYDVGGFITAKVSEETGLIKGIPVAVGAHDISACAVGVGAIDNNITCMIAGTWSINEVVDNVPHIGDGWMCRNFIEKGRWLHQSSSPASAINLEWYLNNYILTNNKYDETIYQKIEEEIKNVSTKVIFLPFIFGSPFKNGSGSFIGIKGDYKKRDLLRAIYEGVEFNHMYHIELLEEAFDIKKIRLTGGASKSEFWSQLFADVMEKKVETVEKPETGCFGNALIAMLMLGKLKKLEDIKNFIQIKNIYSPNKSYSGKYSIYLECCKSLERAWSMLNKLDA